MVKILADSTCDLSPELIRRYGIRIIPLYVRLGDEEYRDGVNIEPDRLYRWSDEHGETPTTAAPGVQDFENYLYKDSEDEYVVFTISSSMSACFNNCRLAAEDLEMQERVFLIDSENLSTGIGLLVLRAAELAQKGMSGAAIRTEIEKIRGDVRASFVVDTLVYLHRGGRCSGLSAFLGSALKLHPRIEVAGGTMHPGKKYRGKMDRCIPDYVRDMEEDLLTACEDRVFITHSGCTEETIAAVREYLESLGHFKEIHITRAGAVISSHCGPGTLGVLFIAGK